MRIVLDLQACQTTGSRNRGIGRYSMSLSQAMVRQARGHEVLIALNDSFPETIDPVRKAFDGLLHKNSIRTFNVAGPLSQLDPANMWRARTAERIRENFLAGLAPDIVHVSSLFEGPGDNSVTATECFSGRFDSAVTLYDLIPLLNKEIYLTHPGVREWYYRKLLSLKNADLLLSISEHSRREAVGALQLPEDQVVNISSAVDSVFRPRILSIEESASLRNRYGFTRPFIMYTGGIDHRKNIEGLIEAFARLPNAVRTQYQLAVVCSIDEDNRRRLEALARKFGLEKSDVVLTGFVPEADLVALYNACAMFVFPSLHEGFGLPVLEAMCCGAAVIGSNTSSIPEVIGRDDALFNPRDVSAITGKMFQVLTDEEFRSALQRHGPVQAKRFSWDASAQRAWDAFEHQHERRQQRERATVAVRKSRPRMAYLSPLPPEKSGIADYSAELLPELARHYEIEVVVTQEAVSDSWIAANFPIRTVEWFSVNASRYDRILYHFGNSSFHLHMFDLLARHPGVVVLHDFFMSGLLEFAHFTGAMPGVFDRALYESHGYSALIDYRRNGREAAKWTYPCNKWILDNALGMIVHSRFSLHLARKWYGEGSAADWQLIPHLRALPEKVDREAARRQLELPEDGFLVCSFGLLGPTKLNDRLLDAWLASPLAQDKRCQLVFVGENHAGPYGHELLQKIDSSGCRDRIKITGFASQELYRTYLAGADAAVQLRTRSRGETSGTVFDCMAYGVPTIINVHGSSSDLPDEVLLKLPDEFTVPQLADALTSLLKNPSDRRSLAERAIEHIRTAHHPAKIGAAYRDAIELLSAETAGARYQRLVDAISKVAAPVPPSSRDIAAAAASIAANQPARTPRQIFVDVSGYIRTAAIDAERMLCGAILDGLLNEPIDGYRVEPVYVDDGQFKYARRFTLDMIGASEVPIEDTLIETRLGDVFLALGEVQDESLPALLARLRHRGVDIYSVSVKAMSTEGHLSVAPPFADWLNSFSGSVGLTCIERHTKGNRSGPEPTAQSTMRANTRRQAGLKEDDFMVCLFGTPGSQELDERFLVSWLSSSFAANEHYHLVFVGDCNSKVADSVTRHDGGKRIHIAGDSPRETRNAYLRSADAALLLQPGAHDFAASLIADCVAHDVPAIVGTDPLSMKGVGRMLLWLRNGLPNVAPAEDTLVPHASLPSRVVGIYRDYLEQIASRRLNRNRGTNAVKPLRLLPPAESAPRQLLVDVTYLARHNLNSGIQRVVHHILVELLKTPPAGYCVEPVYDAGGYYAYARRFKSDLCGTDALEDEPIMVKADDIFLGLDLSPDSVRENRHVFADFRNHGVQVFFVVYDLLPVLRPDVFPADAQATFGEWLDAVVTIADGLVGISRTVADEVTAWVGSRQIAPAHPLHIGYFHLGAEMPAEGTSEKSHQQPHARPCLLMVGTVEPRKGHAQALAAFERLWARGVDVDLVIVGRQGWMVESLVTRLRTHPEHGKHLFWFEGASDETLFQLYETSSALLLASEGEGFGLPLIEAAHHKLPIITRDLPVFREVAGDHAFYFNGTSEDSLYEALNKWLLRYSENRIPSSAGIRWLTWTDSAKQLLDAIVDQHWHRTLPYALPAIAEQKTAAVIENV